MTVIRWIKDGKIPAFKTAGGHRRILHADLERFCQGRGIPFWPDGEPTSEARVLVADTDAGVRDLIAETARQVDEKLTIETAADAFTAGRLLGTFRPNLVFLEQRLPGVDPLETCARLSRDPETGRVSIVVLSPSPTPDTERAFRSRGAFGIIPRPPSRTHVERQVRAAFRLPERPSEVVKIHIVDHDQRSGKILRRDLEGKLPNSRVTHYESTIDALFAVTVEHPDVLVIDIGNLELEPGDLIRRLAARMVDQRIDIIAVAPPTKVDSLRHVALGAGAHAVLVKPCEAEDVIRHVVERKTATPAGEGTGAKKKGKLPRRER